MIICCMNPLLSRISTSVGQRTFLGGCLSFLAFFMAITRLPFHTLASMLLDRSRPSNSGVLTARARDRAGAAMCMRSTPGCGTLAGPSLVLVDFRWSNPKRFADVPGPKRPGALGRPGRPGSVPPTMRSPPQEIWRSYTIHIPFIYQCSLKHALGGIAWCPPPRDACVYAESDLRWQFHGRICSKNATRIKS